MPTPNGVKIQAALEELKDAYGTKFSWEYVDISSNVQKEDWFLKVNVSVYVSSNLADRPPPPPLTVKDQPKWTVGLDRLLSWHGP
jgi:hypothetical protein